MPVVCRSQTPVCVGGVEVELTTGFLPPQQHPLRSASTWTPIQEKNAHSPPAMSSAEWGTTLRELEVARFECALARSRALKDRHEEFSCFHEDRHSHTCRKNSFSSSMRFRRAAVSWNFFSVRT